MMQARISSLGSIFTSGGCRRHLPVTAPRFCGALRDRCAPRSDDALHGWSVAQRDIFWRLLWRFVDVIGEADADTPPWSMPHHGLDLVHGFAEAEHDAGFGQHFRVEFLCIR